MYTYHKFINDPKPVRIILMALSLLMSAMIRFEAWMLPPLLITALLFRARNYSSGHRWRLLTGGLLSCVPAVVFMLFWFYGSRLEYGDWLYSIHAASSEHAVLTGQAIGQSGSLKILLYRAAFWPGVLLISLSPFVLIGGLWGMIKSFPRRRGIEWIAFFVLQVAIYLYQSLITGQLAPLARYTILPGTILCLFSGFGILNFGPKKIFSKILNFRLRILILAVIIWTLFLCLDYRGDKTSYLTKLSSVSPITRYPNSLDPIISWLRNNLRPDQTVIFNSPEFLSNAVIMYSGLTPDQFIAVNEHSENEFTYRLNKFRPSYIIVHKEAPLRRLIESSKFNLENIGLPIVLQSLDSIGEFTVYSPQYEQ
jgi:hypothetical protein